MAASSRLEDFPTAEQVEEQIEQYGVLFTANFWKKLQARGIILTPEQAEIYHIVQKAHVNITGHSLPPTIKGARLTRAQVRDNIGPEVKEEVLEKAVLNGLAAKLAKLRGEQNG